MTISLESLIYIVFNMRSVSCLLYTSTGGEEAVKGGLDSVMGCRTTEKEEDCAFVNHSFCFLYEVYICIHIHMSGSYVFIHNLI